MPVSDAADLGANPAALAVLAREIAAIARTTGDYATAIPALSLHRRHAAADPMPCIYGLGLAVVAQGGKQVLLGDAVFNYGPGSALLTTLDLPVVSNVTLATPATPFLGLLLNIDARTIAQLAAQMDLGAAGVPPPRPRDGAAPA